MLIPTSHWWRGSGCCQRLLYFSDWNDQHGKRSIFCLFHALFFLSFFSNNIVLVNRPTVFNIKTMSTLVSQMTRFIFLCASYRGAEQIICARWIRVKLFRHKQAERQTDQPRHSLWEYSVSRYSSVTPERRLSNLIAKIIFVKREFHLF